MSSNKQSCPQPEPASAPALTPALATATEPAPQSAPQSDGSPHRVEKETTDVVYNDGLPNDQHMRRRNPGHEPSSWRSCRGGGEGCIVHGSEKNWMSLIFVDGFGCPCRVHQSMCPPPWGAEY